MGGLNNGRSHWDGLYGICAGFLRVLVSPFRCQSPWGAWFQNSNEFTEKFLLNQDEIRVSKMHTQYQPPAGVTVEPVGAAGGNQSATSSSGTAKPGKGGAKEQGAGMPTWLIVSLIILGVSLLAFILWYFFFRSNDEEDDFMEDLQRLRAEKQKRGNQPAQPLPAHVPFVYRPPPAAPQASG